MKLYARRTSSNSQKVLWFLGELGLEYEFVATGGDAGGVGRCRGSMKILEKVLADRPFLGGDELSLDDLSANVARWYDTLTERPAFQTHVMLPFDELKGRLRA